MQLKEYCEKNLNEHEIQENIKEERNEMDVTKQQKQGEEEIKNNKGEVAERVKLEELNENEIQEKIKETTKEMFCSLRNPICKKLISYKALCFSI